MIKENLIYISYTPERTKDIKHIRKYLLKLPFTKVMSTWIDLNEDSYIFKNNIEQISYMNLIDIRNSNMLLLFVHEYPTPDQMIEVGIAIANDIPVFINSKDGIEPLPLGLNYKGVYKFYSMDVVNFLRNVKSSSYWSNGESVFEDSGNKTEKEILDDLDMKELEDLIKNQNHR